MKISWETVPLADPRVEAVLKDALSGDRWASKIRLDSNPFGKLHLRAHRDRAGRVFVRCGFRGSGRRYLADCKITSLDDEPTLFTFRLEGRT